MIDLNDAAMTAYKDGTAYPVPYFTDSISPLNYLNTASVKALCDVLGISYSQDPQTGDWTFTKK